MNSKKLREQAIKTDNDLAALGLHSKAMREERLESFENKWYDELLKVMFSITRYEDGSRYVLESKEYGRLTYFPKRNKVLIHNQNTWKKPGLRWLIKTFLENEQKS